MEPGQSREILFIGSSLKDLKKVPQEVQDTFALGFILAREGKKHLDAKPLKGFGGRKRTGGR